MRSGSRRLRFSAELGIAAAAFKGGERWGSTTRRPIRDCTRASTEYPDWSPETCWPRRSSTRQGTIGVVEVVNGRGALGFTDEDLSFIEAISGSIAIAIENARLYEAVRESEARLQTQVGALRRDLARHDAVCRDRRHGLRDG